MRENWSIEALAVTFRVDRRTVRKYLDLAEVKPAERRGPKGHALYPLRAAVAALVDAGYLGSSTERDWQSRSGRDAGARDLAELVMAALAKRLDRAALRPVAEVVAASLHHHIGELYPTVTDAAGAPAPDWPALSDAALEAALRALVHDGYLPLGDEEDAA